jgi:hypothetical protein
MTAEIAGWLAVGLLLLVLRGSRRAQAPDPGVRVLASGLRGTRARARLGVAIGPWKAWGEGLR